MTQIAFLIVALLALAPGMASSQDPGSEAGEWEMDYWEELDGEPDPAADLEEVAGTLDDAHRAASSADSERYFAHFDRNFVYLGTDATERWGLEEFRANVEPLFAKGQGWTYKPLERHVSFSDDAQVAWFDERLQDAKTGEARGSGVLLRRDDGWKLAQYSLSVPIPADLLPGFAREIGKRRPTAPVFEEVGPARAAELLAAREELEALDVRSPQEFAAGHLAGARGLDSAAPDFEAWLGSLNRRVPHLLHCGGEGRCSAARRAMKGLGFLEVYVLPGGTEGWGKGLPVEK